MQTTMNPTLTDVPETMLWTLHNRANEAMRADGVINDSKCIEIYQAIDYDYEKSFGKAEPSHGIRSRIFDDAIVAFVKAYPDAVIINLGEGLETQRFRLANQPLLKNTLWLTVDLPDAIAMRERFINADEQHQHVACSATDNAWFEAVPNNRPVFISAQGLFMYFTESAVCELIQQIVTHFKQGELMFDVIPRWMSKKTCSAKGWHKTDFYITPKMPWGINRNEVAAKVDDWSKNLASVQTTEVPLLFPRGFWHWALPAFKKIPVISNKIPSIHSVKFN